MHASRIAPPAFAAALALAVLAGCTQPEPPGADVTLPPSAQQAFTFVADITIDAELGPTEPSILVDPAGTIWVAGPTGLVTPATEADPMPYTHDSGLWSSTDNGTTWTWNNPLPGYGRDPCPGGGDSDLASSPDGALFLIDLNLGNVPIDVSTDGGKTWSFNCNSSIVPGLDRQWVAADAKSVWIAVNHLALGAIVYRADFMGTPADGLLFGPPTLIGAGNAGNLVVDQKDGTLYLAGSGSTIYVSHDRGMTFQAQPTSIPPEALGGGFRTVSLDREGRLFVGGAGVNGIVVAASLDQGKTWGEPAFYMPYEGDYAFPWIVAGGDGVVNVAWYGRPATAPAAGEGYHVFVAQATDILANGATASFAHERIAGPVLDTDICMGLNCGPGRALGDFFEATVDNQGHWMLAYNNAVGHPKPLLQFAKQTGGVLAPPQTA